MRAWEGPGPGEPVRALGRPSSLGAGHGVRLGVSMSPGMTRLTAWGRGPPPVHGAMGGRGRR